MNISKLFFLYIIVPFFFLATIIFSLLYPNSLFTLKISLLYSIFLFFYLIVNTIRVKIINLFFLFSFSYLIPLFYYSFGNKIITSYNHSNSIAFLSKYLFLFNLFFTIVLCFTFNFKVPIRPLGKLDNKFIYFLNILICLFIAFFSKSGDNIFISGGYGLSEINNLGGFAIGEYFLIFFYSAYKFSGNWKLNYYLLIFVAVLYILISLAYGLRNELIQLSILCFILFYRENGHTFRYILLILFGLYFSSLFSVIRSNPASLLENSLVENLSVKNVFSNDSDNYISHQGDVIHSSSRLIGFRDENILDNSIVYSSSFYFFLSSVVPQKYLPPHANMAAFKQDEYPVGGGGNIFSYFYFWFSFPGVILVAIFVGIILKLSTVKINSNIGTYFILALSTFPRWFAYSPINLFKMCVYGTFVYLFFWVVYKILNKKLINYKL